MWIEIDSGATPQEARSVSRPVRVLWIEIPLTVALILWLIVEAREGLVD